MDMSDKALLMLKHMRKQILGQPAQDASVRGAALSIGVKPEGSEFDALVEELLRGGYIAVYPSPTLTAHGLYRLNELGISAAEEAARPGPLWEAPRGRRPTSSWEGPQDPKDVTQAMARDLTRIVGS